MILGYIRVSKNKQLTALQDDALAKVQYDKVFTDKMTGKRFDRARQLYTAKQNTVAEIMALTGFRSRATFYKYIVNGEV